MTSFEQKLPCRVRFETVRDQIDSGPVRAALAVFPNHDDKSKLDVTCQCDTPEQAAQLVAAVIRWGVVQGVVGLAMQIVATAAIEISNQRHFDTSPPKPGEIPPDDLPPHIRGL